MAEVVATFLSKDACAFCAEVVGSQTRPRIEESVLRRLITGRNTLRGERDLIDVPKRLVGYVEDAAGLHLRVAVDVVRLDHDRG